MHDCSGAKSSGADAEGKADRNGVTDALLPVGLLPARSPAAPSPARSPGLGLGLTRGSTRGALPAGSAGGSAAAVRQRGGSGTGALLLSWAALEMGDLRLAAAQQVRSVYIYMRSVYINTCMYVYMCTYIKYIYIYIHVYIHKYDTATEGWVPRTSLDPTDTGSTLHPTLPHGLTR